MPSNDIESGETRKPDIEWQLRSNQALGPCERGEYRRFLEAIAARVSSLARELGIESRLVDDYVQNVVIIVHHARHTLELGRTPEL